jgi:hypothetical protein
MSVLGRYNKKIKKIYMKGETFYLLPYGCAYALIATNGHLEVAFTTIARQLFYEEIFLFLALGNTTSSKCFKQSMLQC